MLDRYTQRCLIDRPCRHHALPAHNGYGVEIFFRRPCSETSMICFSAENVRSAAPLCAKHVPPPIPFDIRCAVAPLSKAAVQAAHHVIRNTAGHTLRA